MFTYPGLDMGIEAVAIERVAFVRGPVSKAFPPVTIAVVAEPFVARGVAVGSVVRLHSLEGRGVQALGGEEAKQQVFKILALEIHATCIKKKRKKEEEK